MSRELWTTHCGQNHSAQDLLCEPVAYLITGSRSETGIKDEGGLAKQAYSNSCQLDLVPRPRREVSVSLGFSSGPHTPLLVESGCLGAAGLHFNYSLSVV